MNTRAFARILALVLMVSTLLAGSEFGFAARKPIPNKTTTDAAGRTHVRPNGRITDSQRRAAAKLRSSVRENWNRSNKKNGGRQ